MTEIVRDDPVVKPAEAEKIYASNWIYQLLIQAPTTAIGTATFELIPYNYTTKELHPEAGLYKETIHCDALFEAIDEVPEVAAAYNAILACIDPLKVWLQAREEAANPDPIP